MIDLTDLEIMKLCAEAMGFYAIKQHEAFTWASECVDGPSYNYDPLHDDAQAMALVKRFFIEIQSPIFGQKIDGANPWGAVFDEGKIFHFCPELNRAICECVARMQLSKSGKNAKEEESQDI